MNYTGYIVYLGETMRELFPAISCVSEQPCVNYTGYIVYLGATMRELYRLYRVSWSNHA